MLLAICNTVNKQYKTFPRKRNTEKQIETLCFLTVPTCKIDLLVNNGDLYVEWSINCYNLFFFNKNKKE